MQKNFKFKYETSKKSQEAITKFNYYFHELIPDLLPQHSVSSFEDISISRVPAANQVVYFYTRSAMQAGCLVDEESILHAVKATHLQRDSGHSTVLHINDQSFRKMSVLPGRFLEGNRQVHEVIEFVLHKGEAREKNQPPYELYVIHHCHWEEGSNCLKWLNFVERFIFEGTAVDYVLLASCVEQPGFLGWSSSCSSFQALLESYLQMERMQGLMLQYQDRIREKIKVSEDPAYGEETNMLNRIPTQFLKGFYNLRKEFGEENDRTISRFYIAREFKLEETRKSIRAYLEWQGNLAQNYKWEDFEEFHQRNIFYYLGDDLQGRPVILNRAKNVNVNELDMDKYCIYYMYFLEVFLPTRMRGNVNQIVVLADLEGTSTDNFKISVTRRNLEEGSLYCAEREYKFFAVNVTMFAYYCWKFIKPILPKRTVEKIFVGGNDSKEILDNLLVEMPLETIPSYLGGANPII